MSAAERKELLPTAHGQLTSMNDNEPSKPPPRCNRCRIFVGVLVGLLLAGGIAAIVVLLVTRTTPSPPPPTPPFGSSRVGDFALASGFMNLNHGSFGSTPRAVLKAQQDFVAQVESFPDKWFRVDYKTVLNSVRGRLARYIGAENDEDVAFVENASSAVNAVLRSLDYEPGDHVLYDSTAYGMVKNVVQYLAARYNLTIVEPVVTFPGATENRTGSPNYIEAVRKELEARPNARWRVAMFNHISSVPAVICPAAELARLCKQHGVEAVMIDGAHVLGNIPVNVTELGEAGVDYYLANGHKWLYSPKGSAFLWTRPAMLDTVVPTVLSGHFRDGYFALFEYTGTRDYVPFCSIGAALDYRASLGDAAIMEYTNGLAVWSQEYLAGLWGTMVLLPANETSAMANVRLPGNPRALATFLNGHNIEVVIYELGGQWYIRLSAQIYLEQADIRRFGALVQQYYASARYSVDADQHGNDPHDIRTMGVSCR